MLLVLLVAIMLAFLHERMMYSDRKSLLLLVASVAIVGTLEAAGLLYRELFCGAPLESCLEHLTSSSLCAGGSFNITALCEHAVVLSSHNCTASFQTCDLDYANCQISSHNGACDNKDLLSLALSGGVFLLVVGCLCFVGVGALVGLFQLGLCALGIKTPEQSRPALAVPLVGLSQSSFGDSNSESDPEVWDFSPDQSPILHAGQSAHSPAHFA